MRRVLAILVLLMLGLSSVHAQDYRFEFGPALGMSGYLGDLNRSNMYKHPGVAGGGIFRYIANSRWAVKGNLLYAGLKGNSNDVQSRFPLDQHYEFSSSVIDLGGQVEFNFFHFGSGPRYKNYKRVSPYLTLGLGMSMAFVNGHTNMAMNLPMGFGVKYKLKERLNLGFEFTMRKCFGDGMDGLSDLYGVKHSFAKNTDWYSVAMFTVSYEFSKRCVKCHYVD
ncbi:MAG: outer membrane beta-barrel protein [Muribaculaceae bacterium]|nr:outer membrane beta-barrel protein [Muribaculaceae bacterium]